ncbi:MAG: hypothetical protein DYG89_33750 [Caldilinea sp. CFX5]|nr:hypothetical protein [Caldilinea sp. CFX5]
MLQAKIANSRHNSPAPAKVVRPFVGDRILKVEQDKVTFRYREGDSGRWRTATLSAEEFIE